MKLNVSVNRIFYITIRIMIFLYLFTMGINTEIITNKVSNSIAIVLLLLLLVYQYKTKLRICEYAKRFGLFLFICFFSIMWASMKEIALTRCITLTMIFALTVSIYDYIHKEGIIDTYISIICMSTFAYIIYVVLYGGLNDYIYNLTVGTRLGNSVYNANAIGMMSSTVAILSLWNATLNKKPFFYLSFILCSINTMASGSRTAFIGFIIGLLLLFVFYETNGKYHILKKVFIGLSILLVIIIIFQNSLFSEILGSRYATILDFANGTYSYDGSMTDRTIMVRAGLEQFYKTPLLGLGIGNSRIVVNRQFGFKYYNSYLHNNYIELLVSLGITGFIVYYCMYLRPILKIISYYNKRDKYDVIALAIMSMHLIFDFGTVSYYSKTTYIYMILYYLICERKK